MRRSSFTASRANLDRIAPRGLPRGDCTVPAISFVSSARCAVATVQLVEGAERQLDLSLAPQGCPKLR
jgi:hypothetical protein